VPSILVETAFISNPSEERKLRDPEHQDQLAAAVMGGVKSYFESTPPPGTWFAAQASRRNGGDLASANTRDKSSVALADADADADSGASQVDSSATTVHVKARDMHRVGPGESLRSIANQYGVSISSLKTANQISSNSVRAGTMLAIPTS